MEVERATQPREHRLVGAQVLLGDRRAQLLEQVALLLAEAARDLDVDDDAQVAVAVALEARHAAAAERQCPLAGLGAGRDLELRRAVERRHLEGRAERGARRRHVEDGDEVVAVAHEALVLADRDQDVEVAGAAARLADMAAAPDSQALAVSDPGRDLHRDGAASRRRGRGRGSRAQGCVGTRPSPPHASQTTLRTICPNGVLVTACWCPAPPQRLQVSIGVPGSAPLPRQCSQRATAS